jgi:hypothetical protein
MVIMNSCLSIQICKHDAKEVKGLVFFIIVFAFFSAKTPFLCFTCLDLVLMDVEQSRKGTVLLLYIYTSLAPFALWVGVAFAKLLACRIQNEIRVGDQKVERIPRRPVKAAIASKGITGKSSSIKNSQFASVSPPLRFAMNRSMWRKRVTQVFHSAAEIGSVRASSGSAGVTVYFRPSEICENDRFRWPATHQYWPARESLLPLSISARSASRSRRARLAARYRSV